MTTCNQVILKCNDLLINVLIFVNIGLVRINVCFSYFYVAFLRMHLHPKNCLLKK